VLQLTRLHAIYLGHVLSEIERCCRIDLTGKLRDRSPVDFEKTTRSGPDLKVRSESGFYQLTHSLAILVTELEHLEAFDEIDSWNDSFDLMHENYWKFTLPKFECIYDKYKHLSTELVD
jgi:hypothetical protein